MENLFLICIHKIGINIDNKYEYEFYFTDDKTIYDEKEINYSPCGLKKIKFHDYFDFKEIKIIETDINLSLINTNMCFGYKHAIDGIIALAYEDITDYEEYPENGRLVLKYGMNLNEVEEILKNKDIYWKD